MATKPPTWIKTLRRDLREQNGDGWYPKDVRGRIQLAYRSPDNSQTTCTLELLWAGSSKLALLQIAAAAKPLVESGKCLKDAVALIARSEGITETCTTSWPKVAELFQLHKVGGDELVPQSLLHGYADRASMQGLSDKETALLIGHSLQTHHSHYSGTTADTMARAKAKLQARTRQLQEVA